MPKGNKMIPNAHFHKKNRSQPIKVNFAQPAKKRARHLKRIKKGCRLAPMPVKRLQPIVQCPSQRYNTRCRRGRGFNIQELKRAGMTAKFAQTVGIKFDRRRTSKSIETLQINVRRLKEYKNALIIYPLRKRTKSDSITQKSFELIKQFRGELIPFEKRNIPEIIFVDLKSDKLKGYRNFNAYEAIKRGRQEVRSVGKHLKKKENLNDCNLLIAPKIF